MFAKLTQSVNDLKETKSTFEKNNKDNSDEYFD